MKKLHCVKENKIVSSIGNLIQIGEQKGNTFSIDGVLSDNYSLIKRLIRNDIHAVKCFDGYFIVVVKGSIYIFKNKQKTAEIRIDKGSRPLRDGIAIIDNHMYYGDYWGNPDREAVNLYRVDLTTLDKEIFYRFETARHIHFVQKDTSTTDCLLVGTGDSDEESGIYQLNTKTKELVVLGAGSQKFRAVSMLQVDTMLFWGSDDPDGDNHIYSLDRLTNNLKQICAIEGPAYYSTINKLGHLFMATTIEDRNRHKAIIYRSVDNGLTWETFKQFKKDIWHVKYFGYGIVEFVDGQEEYEELMYNLIGLKESNE